MKLKKRFKRSSIIMMTSPLVFVGNFVGKVRLREHFTRLGIGSDGTRILRKEFKRSLLKK
jgi:hypothetical protein